MGDRTGVVSVAHAGTSALGGMGTASCHGSASNRPAMTTNTAGTNQNDRLRAGPDRPRRVDSTSTTCQLPRQPDGRMLLYRRGPVHVKQPSKRDRFQRAGSPAREKEESARKGFRAERTMNMVFGSACGEQMAVLALDDSAHVIVEALAEIGGDLRQMCTRGSRPWLRTCASSGRGRANARGPLRAGFAWTDC